MTANDWTREFQDHAANGRLWIHRAPGEPVGQLVRLTGPRRTGPDSLPAGGYFDTSPVINPLLGAWRGNLTAVRHGDDPRGIAADFLWSLSRDPLLRTGTDAHRIHGLRLVGEPCIDVMRGGAFFRRWSVMIDGQVEVSSHLRELADAAAAMARLLHERIDPTTARASVEGIRAIGSSEPGGARRVEHELGDHAANAAIAYRNGDRSTGKLKLSGKS
ncbi:MAG: hypothetical protein JJU36_11020 [Phycisphaeraceae bacterium]|nr:hypothetical protein [Phycisphaeraceae bacterium]